MRFQLESNLLRVTEITDADLDRLTSIELAILKRVVVMTTSALKNGKRAFMFDAAHHNVVRETLRGFCIEPEEGEANV